MALHLKIVGRGNPERLNNPVFIKCLLTDLIQQVGMQLLGKPKVQSVELEIKKLGKIPFEDEGGVTGQLVGYATLSTSHVAIHTWPLREKFSLDLYSCREFDLDRAANFIKEALSCRIARVSDLTEFCHEV